MHGMTHSRQRNSSKLDVEGSSPFSRSTGPSLGLEPTVAINHTAFRERPQP